MTNDKGIGARGPCLVECPLNKGPNTSPGNGAGDRAQHLQRHRQRDRHSTCQPMTRSSSTPRSCSRTTLGTGCPQFRQGQGDTVPNVIPPKIGGGSPIKHVFVIVKENRTYDQVLGDLGDGGNGDPSLAQFGAKVTPNLHALALRFGDLDNFYDEGTLSADGHNWIVQAEANDYVEKEFGAFYRSYPAQGGDALAYQRDGFIWNAAKKAGLSVKDYGEYANFFNVSTAQDNWDAWYRDSQILEGKATGPLPIPIKQFRTYADIPSLNAIMNPYYPKFDTSVPDQYRVDIWLRDFKKAEHNGQAAKPHADVGAGRPHRRSARASRPGRRQRPRNRTDHRRDLAQPVLEELGHLRARGRSSERRRPRRRAPQPRIHRQPLLESGRQRQLLHTDRHGPDRRADPRDSSR